MQLDDDEQISVQSQSSKILQRRRPSKQQLPQITQKTTPNLQKSLNINRQFSEQQFSNIKNNKNVVQYPNNLNDLEDESHINFLGKNIDKEIGSLTLHSRIREQENLIIDFKSNIERRIQSIQEETPQKFYNQFKMLQDKEQQYWKENTIKQNNLNENFQQLKETTRKQQDQNTGLFLMLQKKIEQMEYKFQSIQNDFQGINLKFQTLAEQNQKYQYNQNQENQSDGTNISDYSHKLQLIKEKYAHEFQTKDIQIQDLQNQFKDLSEKLLRQEKDLQFRMHKQREEFLDQVKNEQNKIVNLDQIKIDKLLNENDYLKNLMTNVERRIDEEVQKRLSIEFENKAQLDQKLILFKDEIRNDEKQIILGEQKFIQQIHESIASINQIIKFTREELEANLASTQTLFSENIKNINKNTEIIKENAFTKINQLEITQKEFQQRLLETQQSFQEHTQHVNNQLEYQMENTENQIAEFKGSINNQITDQNLNIQKNQKENLEWRDELEKKNLLIFREVSNALKGLKFDFQKEQNDQIERIKDIRSEIVIFQETYQKMHLNLENHAKHVDIQLEFQVKEVEKIAQLNLQQAKTDIQEYLNKTCEDNFKKSKDFTLLTNNQAIQQLQNYINNGLQLEKSELSDKIKLMEENIINKQVISEQYLGQKIHQLHEEQEEIQKELINQINKEREALRDFKYEIEKQNRQNINEFDEKLEKQRQEITVQIQKNNELERKKTEISIKKLDQVMQTQFDVLKAQNSIDLNEMKNDFHKKIKKELEEIVVKKIEQSIKQERNDRIAKEDEIDKQIINTKNMIMETLQQKMETLKSLLKALVNEESVERAKQDQEILKVLKDSVENLNQNLRKLIQSSVEACKYELKNDIKIIEQQLNEFKTWTIKEISKLFENIQNQQIQFENELELRNIYQLVKEENDQELAKQIQTQLIQIKMEQEKNLLEQVKYMLKNDELVKNININLLQNIQETKIIQETLKQNQADMLQMDENLANFEEKTQKNFEINEQAIKSFTKYLNELDARQTMEDLFNKNCFKDMNEKLVEVYNNLLNNCTKNRKDNEKLINIQNEQLKLEIQQMKESVNQQFNELQLLLEKQNISNSQTNNNQQKLIENLQKQQKSDQEIFDQIQQQFTSFKNTNQEQQDSNEAQYKVIQKKILELDQELSQIQSKQVKTNQEFNEKIEKIMLTEKKMDQLDLKQEQNIQQLQEKMKLMDQSNQIQEKNIQQLQSRLQANEQLDRKQQNQIDMK